MGSIPDPTNPAAVVCDSSLAVPTNAFVMQGGGNPKGNVDILVYAPCADIDVRSANTTLRGALVGRNVGVHANNVTVTYDTSLNSGGFLYGPPGPPTPGGTTVQYSQGSASWCQYRSVNSTSCN